MLTYSFDSISSMKNSNARKSYQIPQLSVSHKTKTVNVAPKMVGRLTSVQSCDKLHQSFICDFLAYLFEMSVRSVGFGDCWVNRP